ncbi:hypothetical protein [Roseimarinus sediminis]|uniref:hypothetical protein n=1 Tax=Roseimarinus sediminis TaxID=1610899 RepID=UPI003D1A4CE7
MKTFYILLCLLLSGMLASAQSNFSGTWSLSKDKSKLNAEYSMAPFKLVVQQNDQVLKVERHSSFQGNNFTTSSEYALDGSESINEGWQNMKIKSTCQWNEAKKILTIQSVFPTQDGSEVKVSENYSLVNNEFTIHSKASSSWGNFEETWVYEKE